MATLSSSWKSTLSPANGARSPSLISRPASPSPQAGESATTVAWRNTLSSYRKSLSDKDFKRISIPAGPEDVVNEVEKWHRRQSASRYARVAAAVRAGLGRMQHFSASIDMLAQGSPSPGCLLWGSIKFVLIVVQDAAEEYDKLCQALSRMVDCLPQIELYTETFLDSETVRASVSAFYTSTLRFWTRACKFYRRHKLLNFIRVIWNDFDAEFGELEVNMVENRHRVERAALAEHIGQSKIARVQQQLVSHRLLEVQNSAREKEIIVWLTPAAYDVEYYENDLDNARALRHPKTCQWIFEKEEMGHLFRDAPNVSDNRAHEESFLWVHAQPGAGKTILSSRLIDHYALDDDRLQTGHVLYFFCKSTDADKNNATAVIRSLLYQLFKSTKDPETQVRLTAEIEKALDKSGKRQAVDFAPIWAIFSDNLKLLSPALVILDALDECQDTEQLIQGLKSISFSHEIKIIVTSRKEPHLFTQLRSNLSLEITAEDINSDIAAYVEAKVLGSPRLSHTLVRDRVVAKLTTGHTGMFLWVYLLLKELKSCFSVTQVQGVLANLPMGLDGIYKSILHRLRENLPSASLDFCSKVLTWVVSAVRPLKIDELKHALSLHHEIEGDTLLFEYAEKDIELICGSLVTVRQGTLQVIHLTVKEFLTSTPTPKHSTYSDLLIDSVKASLHLTLACLKCIKINCNQPLSLGPGVARLDIKLDGEAVTQRQRKAPLMEYACLTWMMHLIECDAAQMIGVSKAFKETFESPSTFNWIEACMTFQPDSVLHLLAGLEEIVDYVAGLSPDHWSESESNCVFFTDWCHALQIVFEEYGSTLSRRPWEIHYLDLQGFFSEFGELYEQFDDTSRRDSTIRINGYKSPRSCQPEAQAYSRLRRDVHGGHSYEDSIFFMHDERRRLYFWGNGFVDLSNVRLFVQNATTGQRLPPAVRLDSEAGQTGQVESYGLSPSGEYIVTVYSTSGANYLTLIWQINEDMSFKRRMRSQPWARIIFCHQYATEIFNTTAESVAFTDDGHCLTPSGEIHLASGTRRPLFYRQPNLSFLRPLFVRRPNLSVLDESNVIGSFYSQNGKYLFLSGVTDDGDDRGYRAIRVTLFTETSEHLCSWKDSSRRLVGVSPSGRYLVLSSNRMSFNSGDEFLYVYDCDTSETVQLPFVERLDYWEIKYHFVKDETELIVFIPCLVSGIPTMNVFVWSNLQSDPLLKSYGQLKLDSEISPLLIHINKDKFSALMVSGKGVIQRVDFRTQVRFPDAPDVSDDFPCTISQVSKAGTHWALLSYGQNTAQLQMTDLSSANGPIHRLDLDLSFWDEPYSRAVTLSPDLSLLVVDAQVFSIAEGENSLTSAPFTIDGLAEKLAHFRDGLSPRYWCHLRCLISPCNSCIIFISPGDRERIPLTIYAFRIDLVSRTSSRLHLPLPNDLTYISVDFHPSQYLMLLSYSTSDNEVYEELLFLQIFLVELDSLEMKPIGLPKSASYMKYAKDFWESFRRPPKVSFSDSGTFVQVSFRDSIEPSAAHVLHRLDVDPVTTRYLPLDVNHVMSYGHSHLTPSGEFFIEPEDVDRTSDRLVFMKVIRYDILENGSDPTHQDQNETPVYLENLIFYPASLADSYRYLLLGQNDDELMRLLIVPREGRALEIRPLSLTFNEARRRMESEWRKREALADNSQGKGTTGK